MAQSLTVRGPLLTLAQQSARRNDSVFAAARARLPAALQRGSAAAPANPADTAILGNSVSAILGLRAQGTLAETNALAEEYTAQGALVGAEGSARAEELAAQGFTAEAAAYRTVAGIADENMTIAGIAGNIQRLQEARRATRTIGSQRAALASAGFGAAGSSIDLLRSSFQEAALSDQLIRTQTSLTQGGYRQEAAAVGAQIAGAEMASLSSLELARTHREQGALASASALTLAARQREAGALATANAANQTAALMAYIESSQGGAPLTPAQQLALSTLSDDPSVAGLFTAPGQEAGSAVSSYVNPLTIPGRVGFAGVSGVSFGSF